MLDAVALYMLCIEGAFVLVMFVYLASNLDDLIIDVMFLRRALYRRLFVYTRYPRLKLDDLRVPPEQPIALMLPAWQEAEVIQRSFANLINTLDYGHYQVFVGVYQNDPDTHAEVSALLPRHPHIHIAAVPVDGPTNKADCLNWIVKAIRRYEIEQDINFSAFIMQDAEDIVHPLSLRLFNYLVPRFDLVQIPVISLERRWSDLTGGHYMDEFAEFHSKEIIVREIFAGVVPGAGVGTAYSRNALSFAERLQGETFSTATLTEDYEFSFRLRDAGLRQIFVRLPFERTSERKGPLGTRLVRSTDYICTREYFPNRFGAAVRQKSRWTIGIALQAWESFGWKGSWQVRYLFLRDRKMVVLSHAIPLGLIILVTQIGVLAWGVLNPKAYQPAPMLADDSPLWPVIYANLTLLIWRLAQRHYWTWRYYGWGALPMLSVRYFWAMLINYFAVLRALRLYINYLRTGKPIGWDKTQHEYPDEKALNVFRRRLGDILIERGELSHAQLQAGLARQDALGGLIGERLVEAGYVTQQTMIEALGVQLHLPVWDSSSPVMTQVQAAAILREEVARHFDVVPLELSDDGVMRIGSARLLNNAALEAIEAAAGRPVSLCLLADDALRNIMARFYLADATA